MVGGQAVTATLPYTNNEGFLRFLLVFVVVAAAAVVFVTSHLLFTVS